MTKHKKIICFDIDNVIFKTKGNNYASSKPIKKAILKINELYEKGHTIKLYTARFMGRNKENVKKAKGQGYKMTHKQLEKFGVKFHKLIFGKPSYDILVDDKSIFFKKEWYKRIGKKNV